MLIPFSPVIIPGTHNERQMVKSPKWVASNFIGEGVKASGCHITIYPRKSSYLPHIYQELGIIFFLCRLEEKIRGSHSNLFKCKSLQWAHKPHCLCLCDLVISLRSWASVSWNVLVNTLPELGKSLSLEFSDYPYIVNSLPKPSS